MNVRKWMSLTAVLVAFVAVAVLARGALAQTSAALADEVATAGDVVAGTTGSPVVAGDEIAGQDLGLAQGMGRSGRGRHGGEGMGAGGPGVSLSAVAAELLGMERDELVALLQSGKTIAEVAQEKGVDVQTIVDEAVKRFAEKLDEMVADGRLTREEADAKLAEFTKQIQERVSQPYTSGGSMGPGGGMGRAMGPGGCGGMGAGGPGVSLSAVAAELLGMERDELVALLQSGKTIADVAKEQGVDVQTIIDEAVKRFAEKLDQMVADGKLTREEADAKLAEFTTQIQERVSQPYTPGGGMGRGGRGAGGGGGGGRGGSGRGNSAGTTLDESSGA